MRIPRREISRGQSIVAGSIDAVGCRGGDRGVVLRDEVAPDCHEGFVEVGPLVRRRGTEVGCQVRAVPGADDGVLIFVGYAVFICEGFGEPVGRADEGCFRVDVLEEYHQYCRRALVLSII